MLATFFLIFVHSRENQNHRKERPFDKRPTASSVVSDRVCIVGEVNDDARLRQHIISDDSDCITHFVQEHIMIERSIRHHPGQISCHAARQLLPVMLLLLLLL